MMLTVTVQIKLLKDNSEDSWLCEVLVVMGDGTLVNVINHMLENHYDNSEKLS